MPIGIGLTAATHCALLRKMSQKDQMVRDPRRDVSTSRDRLETETLKSRLHPCCFDV